jgi:hypothetical protein
VRHNPGAHGVVLRQRPNPYRRAATFRKPLGQKGVHAVQFQVADCRFGGTVIAEDMEAPELRGGVEAIKILARRHGNRIQRAAVGKTLEG